MKASKLLDIAFSIAETGKVPERIHLKPSEKLFIAKVVGTQHSVAKALIYEALAENSDRAYCEMIFKPKDKRTEGQKMEALKHWAAVHLPSKIRLDNVLNF